MRSQSPKTRLSGAPHGSYQFFLFKTEPTVYSFDDFLRDKETVWDGVTNPTAVKHLRELKKGAKWVFYHTGEERTAVGTGTVLSVDATDPKVPIVKVKVGQRLKSPKSLDAIKAASIFHEGLRTIAPFIERHMQAFGQTARALARDYLAACERSGVEPEAALLAKVAGVLDGTEPDRQA